MGKKAIGILGGMGPQASAYMYKLLIDMSKNEFGAKNNNDYPEVILYSVPIPDFISSFEKKVEALKILKQKIKKLNNLNISCLSIACNTVHLLIPSLQEISKAPFVSIVLEVANEVKIRRLKRVGLMGSISLIQYGLYQRVLKKLKIDTVLPSAVELKRLESITRNVIAGKILTKDRETLITIAGALGKRGAEGIILGCTELPLVFPQKFKMPTFNSVEILSRALLRKYYKFNTIRKKL